MDTDEKMSASDKILYSLVGAAFFVTRNPEAVVLTAAVAAAPFAPLVGLPVVVGAAVFWRSRKLLGDVDMSNIVGSAVLAALAAGIVYFVGYNIKTDFGHLQNASNEITQLADSKPAQAKFEARSQGVVYKIG